jgi:uncharacterized membrane protein required for colicin V production
MNPILIDVILVLILLLFLAHGFRRGLVASLAGLLSFIVALFGANLIARACTPVVAEWIAPSVEAVLTQRAQSSQEEGDSLPAPSGASSAQEEAETPAPPQQEDPDQNQFLSLLEQLGLYESVAQPVADAARQQVTAAGQTITRALALSLSSTIAFWGLFLLGSVLLRILLGILVRGLKLLVRLPVLSQLNRLAGLVFGLVQGLAVLFLIAWVVGFLGQWIPEETVEQTVFLRWLTSTTPFALLSV